MARTKKVGMYKQCPYLKYSIEFHWISATKYHYFCGASNRKVTKKCGTPMYVDCQLCKRMGIK